MLKIINLTTTKNIERERNFKHNFDSLKFSFFRDNVSDRVEGPSIFDRRGLRLPLLFAVLLVLGYTRNKTK